jgi:hypothetical protein
MRKVFDYISLLGLIYQLSEKLTESKAAREEAYMYINEVYDPEHLLVLEAARELIRALSKTEDYYDAERFARICYQSLTRPHLDSESFEAAKATGNLAKASYDLIEANGLDSAGIEEAEMLTRDAIRIIRALKGSSDPFVGFFSSTLIQIKFIRKDYGDVQRV